MGDLLDRLEAQAAELGEPRALTREADSSALTASARRPRCTRPVPR